MNPWRENAPTCCSPWRRGYLRSRFLLMRRRCHGRAPTVTTSPEVSSFLRTVARRRKHLSAGFSRCNEPERKAGKLRREAEEVRSSSSWATMLGRMERNLERSRGRNWNDLFKRILIPLALNIPDYNDTRVEEFHYSTGESLYWCDVWYYVELFALFECNTQSSNLIINSVKIHIYIHTHTLVLNFHRYAVEDQRRLAVSRRVLINLRKNCEIESPHGTLRERSRCARDRPVWDYYRRTGYTRPLWTKLWIYLIRIEIIAVLAIKNTPQFLREST